MSGTIIVNGAKHDTADAKVDQAQIHAAALNAELASRRMILNADQLSGLVSPRARMEASFPELHAYFFSIDGVLNGKKIAGAMFAGECMLVFSASEAGAQAQANAGLRSTIELLRDEFDTRNLRVMSAVEAGLQSDVGGRKAGVTETPPPAQKQRSKLLAMIEHIIGGKPWKW